MYCYLCGEQNPEGYTYCGYCGVELPELDDQEKTGGEVPFELYCPHCHGGMLWGMRYCGTCGKKLPAKLLERTEEMRKKQEPARKAPAKAPEEPAAPSFKEEELDRTVHYLPQDISKFLNAAKEEQAAEQSSGKSNKQPEEKPRQQPVKKAPEKPKTAPAPKPVEKPAEKPKQEPVPAIPLKPGDENCRYCGKKYFIHEDSKFCGNCGREIPERVKDAWRAAKLISGPAAGGSSNPPKPAPIYGGGNTPKPTPPNGGGNPPKPSPSHISNPPKPAPNGGERSHEPAKNPPQADSNFYTTLMTIGGGALTKVLLVVGVLLALVGAITHIYVMTQAQQNGIPTGWVNAVSALSGELMGSNLFSPEQQAQMFLVSHRSQFFFGGLILAVYGFLRKRYENQANA